MQLAKAQRCLIPWMGSKYKLRNEIIARFPEHKIFAEGFFGGGAIFFNKKRSHVEVINDINSDLINLYKIVKYHKEALIIELEYMFASREMFDQYINNVGLTDIQRAARYFFKLKANFGGKEISNNYAYSLTRPQFSYSLFSEIIRKASARLSKVNIENCDISLFISRYDSPQTLFYLDPPYFSTTSYKSQFLPEQYQLLASSVASSKANTIITMNDCEFARDIFKEFNIYELETRSMLAKIKNTSNSKELLITNF